MKATPYEDINTILDELRQELVRILSANLVGLYLTGSLSYGDFNPQRSDIDLLAVVREPVSPAELRSLKDLHARIEANHTEWSERIECSYTPLALFQEVLPPKEPRPYVGEGKLYAEADYGNEWLINNYLLYQHGITLYGPDFRTLLQPVSIEEVQKASARDLFREWAPKITDPEYLSNSHYQSYVVLNLCRILYTVVCAAAGSKKVAAAWVKQAYPEWSELIETAERWTYGMEMHRQEETIQFIRFAIDQVTQSDRFQADDHTPPSQMTP